MNNHIEKQQEHLLNITPELKTFLNKTRAGLKGTERRQFMARVVSLMGNGGQRRAQNELGWERGTKRISGRGR